MCDKSHVLSSDSKAHRTGMCVRGARAPSTQLPNFVHTMSTIRVYKFSCGYFVRHGRRDALFFLSMPCHGVQWANERKGMCIKSLFSFRSSSSSSLKYYKAHKNLCQKAHAFYLAIPTHT